MIIFNFIFLHEKIFTSNSETPKKDLFQCILLFPSHIKRQNPHEIQFICNIRKKIISN